MDSYPPPPLSIGFAARLAQAAHVPIFSRVMISAHTSAFLRPRLSFNAAGDWGKTGLSPMKVLSPLPDAVPRCRSARPSASSSTFETPNPTLRFFQPNPFQGASLQLRGISPRRCRFVHADNAADVITAYAAIRALPLSGSVTRGCASGEAKQLMQCQRGGEAANAVPAGR